MDRFPVLQIAAVLLSVVSVIFVVAGALLIADASQANAAGPVDPFGFTPQLARLAGPAMVAGGASLILFGLMGAMLSGGVRVLIAIEGNIRETHALQPKSVKE